MASLSTFATTAASLTLTTGRMLELQPGTNRVLTRLEGWFSPAGTRRNNTERLWSHGSFAERGWRDQRIITVGGHVYTDTRAEAAAMADELAAVLADGTAGEFVVDDADLGRRSATVFLTGTPKVDWNGDRDVTFMIDMVAPDPRKYGDRQEIITPAAAPGGGLDFGLFAGADSTTRLNYALNPEANGTAAGFATYAVGTSETGSTTYITDASDGPVSIRSYTRRSVTAAKTGGSTGWDGRGASYRAPLVGKAGDQVTASVYVRYTGSGTQTIRLRVAFYNEAGSSQPATDSAAVTLTSGVWTRLSVTSGASTEDFASVGWWAYQTTGQTLPAGSTLDATGLLIESGATLRDFFSGRTASNPGVVERYWGGTPDASLSTEVSYAAGGGSGSNSTGVLDFGAVGASGTATFDNVGTAETSPVFIVSGYAPGFTITETSSGARLVYSDTVLAGQTVVIDASDGSVLLDGYADRSAALIRREWTKIPGKTRQTYLFESPGNSGATLTLGARPAWW